MERLSLTGLSLEASVLERDVEKGMSHIISDLNDNEMDHDIFIHFPDAIRESRISLSTGDICSHGTCSEPARILTRHMK